MSKRVLVTGAGGFIGRALVGAGATGVPHEAIGTPGLLEGVACAIHAGRHPDLGTHAWRVEDDPEIGLGTACADAGVPLVTLSSRKATAPADAYGRHKRRIEERLAAVPGLSLTVLRLANVFGWERGRRSFMGAMLDGLAREGTIRFDMSPFTRRDFIPVDHAARAILALAARLPGGIVPLGSGVALECGRLALAVMAGFGRGRLVCESPDERDAFVLHPPPGLDLPGSDAILAEARRMGRRLRREI